MKKPVFPDNSPTPQEIRIKQRMDALSARLEQKRRQRLEAERKRDTRRKIVVGAIILNVLSDERTPAVHRDYINSVLDKALSESRDRELFGLDYPPPSLT
jgi:predicted N-acyltransferase